MIAEVAIGLGISYCLLFILSIFLKDNSIADIFWGLGFLQVTVHSFILSGSRHLPQMILLGLITMWSLRISGYILSKKLLSKKEDPRYKVWRDTWKYFYLRSFFQVYIFQGFLLLIVAVPILILNSSPPEALSALFIIGSLISVFGLLFETIADLQLRSFNKTKEKGQIMTAGLWRYSRHPNYFGESVFWLGISLMALQVSIFALVGWALITFLLRFVSGVPLAEARYKDNKDYIDYQKRTPPIFPNFFLK
jgi:steroid 5-alpha reductase family enzyme